ncbi:MAG TPA: AAA family ATPase [Acidimicrobiales bacterium]|nr:AAA family ATPase [Acidimicrobiales bacterium]
MMRRRFFRGRVRGGFLIAYGVAAVAGLLILIAWPERGGPVEVTLSVIDGAINAGEVRSAVIDDDARTIRIERYDGSQARAAYPTTLGAELARRLLDAGSDVTVEPAARTPVWVRLGVALLPLVAIIAIFLIYSRRVRSGASAFAKGRRLVAEVPEARFADVGGVDEVVAELAEIGDFLNHPERFTASGARAPRGVLLTGPPGTGKTMLARAVAGEAGVPFYALSGSDFVETFVGVGAARIRRVFELARKGGRGIIFIDEIDAVGKSRSASHGGGDTDERERTLNQLLVEMDGFTQSGVIVLAATNRADLLDPALLRPGRFDRTITVGKPDRRGRTKILELAAKRHRFGADVDFVDLARRTPGMTGADLGALVNEAALEATRSGVGVIVSSHLESALATNVLGRERRSAVVSERDRRVIAWHEAGHAVCALLTPAADDPVHVTIVPRNSTGGSTWMGTGEDLLLSRSQAIARLVVAMGGRAAEEILLDGDYTSGSSDDYAGARILATHMVARYAMGKMGVAHVGLDAADGPPAEFHYAINQLLEDSLMQARALLRSSPDLLKAITVDLLDDETLTAGRLAELRRSFDPGGLAGVSTHAGPGLEPAGLTGRSDGRQL